MFMNITNKKPKYFEINVKKLQYNNSSLYTLYFVIGLNNNKNQN